MESRGDWLICVYLCVAVCSYSEGNTIAPSIATGQPRITLSPVNTAPNASHANAQGLDNGLSLNSGGGLTNSSGNSTGQLPNNTHHVNEQNTTAANKTSGRGDQPENGTNVGVPASTGGPLTPLPAEGESASAPGGVVREVTPTGTPPLVTDTEGGRSPSGSRGPATTIPIVRTTAAPPQDATKHTINGTHNQTAPSSTEGVGTTSPSSKSPRAGFTSTALSTQATSALPAIVAKPTSVKPTTTTKRVTTILSVNPSGENSANIHGNSESISSKTKVDPLVVGIITVFFVIIGVLSILGYLKYRQRVNQPEFRRLHELPMDDMMEEDTPLSLYSY